MVNLQHVPTHELIAEILKRCAERKRTCGMEIVTVVALRKLRNVTMEELDRRYPAVLGDD